MSDRREWFETNRRMWDERVPIHVKGPFYDVDGFRAGGMPAGTPSPPLMYAIRLRLPLLEGP